MDAGPPARAGRDERERAAGFLLLRAGAGGPELLLLRNRGRGEWGLPKGHAEPGEGDLATALRETAEETGLVDLAPDPWFVRELCYPATRKGRTYQKTVAYLIAHLRSGTVRLSDEHDEHRWARLPEALGLLPFAALAGVVREAALYLKDPALFGMLPATEAQARAHLVGLPQADERLVAHLEGGARLARALATALAQAGLPVHVEAAAVGTLLHDVGRALGQHEDHQRAGLRHLRSTPLAPYGFACISHFTKGASEAALLAAGLPRDLVHDFRRLVDGASLTWEERCAALADACMMGTQPVPPAVRFADLRRRYDAPALIDLQEQRTASLRAEVQGVLGRDPVALLGLRA